MIPSDVAIVALEERVRRLEERIRRADLEIASSPTPDQRARARVLLEELLAARLARGQLTVSPVLRGLLAEIGAGWAL